MDRPSLSWNCRIMNRHINFDLCDILIQLPDGSYTTKEIERLPKLPWRDPQPFKNAHPERMKLCPTCGLSQPIAEFLIPDAPLRSVRYFELCEFVAGVREWCIGCQLRSEEAYGDPLIEEVTILA